MSTIQKINNRPKGTSQKFNRSGAARNTAVGNLIENAETLLTPKQAVEKIRSALPSFATGVLKIGEEEMVPSSNQKKIMALAKAKDVLFVNGPIGTGKTIWTVYAGLLGLSEGRWNRIALTAPAVEADEKLGFLTGDKDEKMFVHVNQILEAIDDLIKKPLREQLVTAGIIEIAPHAFNRGRTYKKTYYILDESQNASARQLMTSIGRLGFKSTFVYMGDDKQNDRTTKRSAFVSFMKRFNNEAYSEEIGYVKLGAEDVRRHPLLLKMVKRGDDRPLDGFENRQDSYIGEKPALQEIHVPASNGQTNGHAPAPI